MCLFICLSLAEAAAALLRPLVTCCNPLWDTSSPPQWPAMVCHPPLPYLGHPSFLNYNNGKLLEKNKLKWKKGSFGLTVSEVFIYAQLTLFLTLQDKGAMIVYVYWIEEKE